MNPNQTVPPSGQTFPNYNVTQQQPQMYPQQGYPQMQMMPPKKSNSVLIIIIVLLLVLILAGGGVAAYFILSNKTTGGDSNNTTTTTTAVSTTTTVVVPTTISGYKLYTNSTSGFSFQYPTTWTKTLNPSSSVLVMVYNSDQNVRANVVTESLTTSYTLESYATAARTSLNDYNPTNFQSSNVTINGVAFKKFSYNVSGNYAEQYITVSGRTAYILSIITLDQSTYSEFSEEIGNIVNTFSIQ